MAITNFIPELWAAAVQEPFEKSLVFGQPSVANRKYEGQISQHGDTVHVTSIADPTVRAYDKTTDLVIEDVTDSSTALVIDQGEYFNFRVNDVDKVQAAGDFQSAGLRQASYKLRDAADQYIAGLFVESVSTGGPIAANRLGDIEVVEGENTGAHSAWGVIVKLREALDGQSVPLEGRYAVVSPGFISALSFDPRFTDASASGSVETFRNGFVSRVQGFDILVSNNLPVAGDVTTIVAGVPDALSFAGQINDTEALRSEVRFADVVRGLHIYGAKIFRRDGVATANITIESDLDES